MSKVYYKDNKSYVQSSPLVIEYNQYSTQSNDVPGVVGAFVDSPRPGDAFIISDTSQIITPVVGNYANYNFGADWNGSNGNVTTVGTNGDPSAYGTYDQTGQVWEWNETAINAFLKGVRGGSWLNTDTYIGSTYRGFTGAGASFGNGNVGFRIGCGVNESFSGIEFVDIGDPGNEHDITGFGAVNYEYKISKYPITNDMYAEFLNFKAQTDDRFLYNNNMGTSLYGGIIRSGSSGSYTYEVKPYFGNKPVVYISWFDALRFANWLHNGGNNGSTEDGAYPLNGALSGVFTRNIGAKFFLPSEDEWYKAAYYKKLRKFYVG